MMMATFVCLGFTGRFVLEFRRPGWQRSFSGAVSVLGEVSYEKSFRVVPHIEVLGEVDYTAFIFFSVDGAVVR